MKFQNDREVKPGDPFVFVDDKNQRLPGSPNGIIQGITTNTGIEVANKNPDFFKGKLHLEDFNKLQSSVSK